MSFSSHPQNLPDCEPIRALYATGRGEASILSLGNDYKLLETRAAVLQMTGCDVVSALPRQASRLLSDKRFSLAIFGHTLLDTEAAELALLARRSNPNTKLLLCCFDPRPPAFQQLFDAMVESWTGPAALLRAAGQLLAKDGTELIWRKPH